MYAQVEEIARNTLLEVNGRHPYVIYCTCRDEYKDVTYRFKSENIWDNPELAVHSGDTVKVYVEGENYKNYYVDTESLLNGKIVDLT